MASKNIIHIRRSPEVEHYVDTHYNTMVFYYRWEEGALDVLNRKVRAFFWHLPVLNTLVKYFASQFSTRV
jgi:hypothetical protein